MPWITACTSAGAQIVRPPISKSHASGNDVTVARSTEASAIGDGVDTNISRWTATNGGIESQAARQNDRPCRR